MYILSCSLFVGDTVWVREGVNNKQEANRSPESPWLISKDFLEKI